MTKAATLVLAPALFATISAADASETFDGQTFFFGDLHAHTGVSHDAWSADGGAEDEEVHDHWESVSSACPVGNCGTMEAVFDTAIDNWLDFVALTDHHDSDEGDFDWLLELSLRREDLIVIPSVELRYQTTGFAHYGHKNMYVFQDGDLTGLDSGHDGRRPIGTRGPLPRRHLRERLRRRRHLPSGAPLGAPSDRERGPDDGLVLPRRGL